MSLACRENRYASVSFKLFESTITSRVRVILWEFYSVWYRRYQYSSFFCSLPFYCGACSLRLSLKRSTTRSRLPWFERWLSHVVRKAQVWRKSSVSRVFGEESITNMNTFQSKISRGLQEADWENLEAWRGRLLAAQVDGEHRSCEDEICQRSDCLLLWGASASSLDQSGPSTAKVSSLHELASSPQHVDGLAQQQHDTHFAKNLGKRVDIPPSQAAT